MATTDSRYRTKYGLGLKLQRVMWSSKCACFTMLQHACSLYLIAGELDHTQRCSWARGNCSGPKGQATKLRAALSS